MTGRRIAITGYKLSKDGRQLVPDYRHLPVSLQIQRRANKRARIAKVRTLDAKRSA